MSIFGGTTSICIRRTHLLKLAFTAGRAVALAITQASRNITTHGASVRDGYQERDKGVYPTQASWNSYEIVYDSFDGTNYYWDVLVNGNRIEQVINNDLQTTAQALVGGETVAHINNEIKTSAQPEVLLQAPSVAWTEWTPALMVSAQDAVTTCTDATFTWTNYHLYDNFYVQGYVTA